MAYSAWGSAVQYDLPFDTSSGDEPEHRVDEYGVDN
jgi:hypothetical protein